MIFSKDVIGIEFLNFKCKWVIPARHSTGEMWEVVAPEVKWVFQGVGLLITWPVLSFLGDWVCLLVLDSQKSQWKPCSTHSLPQIPKCSSGHNDKSSVPSGKIIFPTCLLTAWGPKSGLKGGLSVWSGKQDSHKHSICLLVALHAKWNHLQVVFGVTIFFKANKHHWWKMYHFDPKHHVFCLSTEWQVFKLKLESLAAVLNLVFTS